MDDISGSVAVIGFPRSGNQWAAWVCRYLTGDDEIRHVHWQESIARTNGRPLVFCLRNYKECFVRHCWHRGADISVGTLSAFFDEMMGNGNINYVELLRAYHEHPGPKFLDVYEDMIADPKYKAIYMARFLGTGINKTLKLINDWDNQMAECIAKSNGATVKKYVPIEHSLHLTSEMKTEWDTRMRQATGEEIWDTYLRRYAEKPS